MAIGLPQFWFYDDQQFRQVWDLESELAYTRFLLFRDEEQNPQRLHDPAKLIYRCC